MSFLLWFSPPCCEKGHLKENGNCLRVKAFYANLNACQGQRDKKAEMVERARRPPRACLVTEELFSKVLDMHISTQSRGELEWTVKTYSQKVKDVENNQFGSLANCQRHNIRPPVETQKAFIFLPLWAPWLKVTAAALSPRDFIMIIPYCRGLAVKLHLISQNVLWRLPKDLRSTDCQTATTQTISK